MQLCRKQEAITRKFILDKIDDYSIYRYYFPSDFKINRPTINILRGEHQASFTIFQGIDGKLHHHDQADDYWKGDCFNLVCQKYGITLYEALCKIAKDFFLVDSPPDAYKVITSQYVKPIVDTKRYSLIQVTTRAMTVSDYQYWNQFLIDKEDLKREQIYAVKELFLNRKKIPVGVNDKCYAYWYPEGFKIYMPEKEKTERWISNITTAKVEAREIIPQYEQILITKSKKDRICLSKLVPWVINVQNETRSCFTDELVEELSGKQVWVNYDSDIAGKKASWRLTEQYGYKHLNVPDIYAPVKDYSDLIKEHGVQAVIKHLKEKKIIV